MTPFYESPLHGERSGGGARWVAGFVLALLLGASFASLMLYLVSAESPAMEAHRRVANALVEGDALFGDGYEAFLLTAEASEPGEALEYPDWPVRVTVTREEALASTPESLRALLLERSANTLYADGTGAFRDPDATGDPGRFSAAGIVDSFLDLLREDVHDAALIAMLSALVLALAVAGLLAMLTRGFGRVIAIGSAALVASLGTLAVAGVLNAYMRVSSDSDTEFLRAQLLHVGEELTMITLATAVALTAASGAMLVLGILGARWADRRPGGLAFDRRAA